MTEQEWLSCTSPNLMLGPLRMEVNDRKARLFATACIRRVWRLLGEAGQQAVEVVDRYADYGENYAVLRAAAHAATVDQWTTDQEAEAVRLATDAVASAAELQIWAGLAYTTASARAVAAAARAAGPPGSSAWTSARATEEAAQARLVRCLFCHPWRSPATPVWLKWRNGIIARMALAAYEERNLPSGLLDNGRLAVLADALDEAGCDDRPMLAHLRDGGEHVRGCWVLDQLLNRS